MKSILKPVNQITSSKIAPIPTRRKDKKQKQAEKPFQNNHSPSLRSHSPFHNLDKQLSVSAYKCGCDYSTNSIHSFKNHVIDVHRGEFVEGSNHFLSGMTKVVLPCIKEKHQSSWKRNKLNSQDSEWKTKLKESPSEIWWNGFVLIQNRHLKRSAFYCGHCLLPFARIIDFINHCLTECGQLQNETSSHFIYIEADWEIKVKENYLKLKTKSKSMIKQHKFNEQLEKSKQIQIEKTSKLQYFHGQILNFTVNYFSVPREATKFKFEYTYTHVSNEIIYVNDCQQNSNVKERLFKCFNCGNTFSSRLNFYKHLYANNEKQDVRSNLLVFNKEVFYQANQESMKKHLNWQRLTILNRRLDYDFWEYLAKKNALSQQLLIYFQSILRYEGIIKSFSSNWANFQVADILFKCDACGFVVKNNFHSNCSMKLMYSHIYQGNKQCYSKNYAFIYLDDSKNHHSRKYVVINLKSEYLKDAKFICPCQKNIILSKAQFVNHVAQEHEGVIHIKFYSTSSIFE